MAAAEGGVAAVTGIDLGILELGVTWEFLLGRGLHQIYFIYSALKLSKNQHQLNQLSCWTTDYN